MNMNPNSKLWLCKTNLENDYKNTLTFSTINDQRNYFIGNPLDPTSHGTSTIMYTDYTYLRIEQAIKVDDFIENIDTNNYAVILNNNKYYYYFITSMDYVDEVTTRINIELDVMQTYFFDIEYKQTFVEREHVTDDTAGKHTIPEGLETGEYIATSDILLSDASSTNIVIQAVYEDGYPNLSYQYGGIFSGSIFMVMDITNAIKYIKYMDEQGKRDYIISIFMYKGTIKSTDTYNIVDYGGTIICEFNIVTPTSNSTTENFVILASKPTTLASYTPRNKKLLTYPYCFLLADNNVGGVKPYKYEDFGLDGVSFTRISTVTIGGSVYYAPRNYKWSSTSESSANLNEGFAGAKYPVCSWVSDSYTNWQTQNSVNERFTFGQDAIQSVTGAGLTTLGMMTGNIPLLTAGVGTLSTGLGSTINDVVSDMATKEAHQVAPMELRGNASLGDVMYAHNRSLPHFYTMSIKAEYARVIDKFFDQFGYKVNTLKAPSIHTRSYWNYLKTRNCNFTGNIPQEYMVKIKSIFDNGITFWHDPSKMFDYSQTNSVLS